MKKRVNGTWVTASPMKYGTLTDTITSLPADLYADGNNATVGLVGNMVQTGTPTPSNPIQPQETGDRTENLFDVNDIKINTFVRAGNTTPSNPLGQEVPNAGFNCSGYIPINENAQYTVTYPAFQGASGAGMVFYTAPSIDNAISGIPSNEQSITYTFTAPIGAKYLRLSWKNSQGSNVMLNSGSTALPYEPYGIKIPISSASTTTPVYLGEVETTRKIRKIKLETPSAATSVTGGYQLRFSIYPYNARSYADARSYCNIAEWNGNNTRQGHVASGQNIYITQPIEEWSSVESATEWLSQHDVFVWYALATETTGIVNEPLRKIGDYADTVSGISIPTITGKDSFDVQTTLKPSEVTANYHGWHVGTVHERESGAWTE